jgi:hypothetical protein
MSAQNGRTAPSEQESREVAEAARETEWTAPSFVRELFLGNFRLDLIHPYPTQTAADKAKTDAYVAKLRRFMEEKVDSDEIDRTGELPPEVVQGLRDLGAFGLKIPEEYGGVGLSQLGYGRAIGMVTSQDGNLTALLSAHQSIGVPQPMKMFGTPEQKKKYLPRLAKGAISAFALTEPGVGSDPAALGHHGHAHRGRHRLHPQRREAVVHQRHPGRAAGGDGEDAVPRSRTARRSRRSPRSWWRWTRPGWRSRTAATSWGCGRCRTP